MNPVSRNPRVPAAQPLAGGSGSLNAPCLLFLYFWLSVNPLLPSTSRQFAY